MDADQLSTIDPLLDEAKAVSKKRGSVSVVYIQRTLRIGYVRAARLVDLMIEDGFCEPEYAEGEAFRRLKNIETNDLRDLNPLANK